MKFCSLVQHHLNDFSLALLADLIQHSLDGTDSQLVDQSLCLLLGANRGAALTDQSLNRALELVEYGFLSGDDLTHDAQSPLNQLLLVAVRGGQDIARCLLNRLNGLCLLYTSPSPRD